MLDCSIATCWLTEAKADGDLEETIEVVAIVSEAEPTAIVQESIHDTHSVTGLLLAIVVIDDIGFFEMGFADLAPSLPFFLHIWHRNLADLAVRRVKCTQ